MSNYLKRYFDITVVARPENLDMADMGYDLVIIDHNFTPDSGIDVLMAILQKQALPVLMLTPSTDPQSAIEALRVGAFNYIIKTGEYLRFLNIAIDDALSKFMERRQFKETIAELKEKISELEKKSGLKSSLAPKKGVVTPREQVVPAPEPVKEINLMEEIISRFKKGEVNLPTLPDIHVKFNALIKEGANLNEVAAFLKQDVAITSKMINVANSALYRGIEKTTRLEDAISKLGLGKTRQYVEIIANRSLYTATNKRFGKWIETLWEHSLATAFATERIKELLHLDTKIDVFALGLTHDIGKLILIQVIGELEIKGKYNDQISDGKIHDTLKAYHGKFGAVLLNRWGFPQVFKDVAMYHDHFKKVDNPGPEFLCVHFANLLATSLGYNMEANPAIDLSSVESAYLLRLRPDDIEDLSESTASYIQSIKNAL